MSIIKMISKYLAFLIIASFVVWIFVFNWSFVFKQKIIGEVVAVEKVNGTLTVVTNSIDPINPQAFSFSVAIKDLKTNEIHMASSEDRKWAAAQKGNCVVSAFFPYPPWQFSKGMSDHKARLLQNFENCEKVPDQSGLWNKIKFFFLWY